MNFRKKREGFLRTALLLIFLLVVSFSGLFGQEQPTPDDLRKQADTLLKQRHYPAAISAYRELIAVTEKRTDLADSAKKELANLALCQISLAYYQQRNYRQAIEEADKIKTLFVDYGYYMKASCYQTLGQYAEAIRWFEKLTAEFPGSRSFNQARFQIARTLYFQGNKLQALLAFSRLPKEPEDYPDKPETARQVEENIKFIAEQLRVRR